MQIVYRNEINPFKDFSYLKQQQILDQDFINNEKLFLYLLLFFVKIGDCVHKIADRKAAKFFPNAQDINYSRKLATNSLLLEFKKVLYEKNQINQTLENNIDNNLVLSLFSSFAETPLYQDYINPSTTVSDKAVISYLWEEILLENQQFWEHVEMFFPSFESDLDWINVYLNNFFTLKPKYVNCPIVDKPKVEFAVQLLKFTTEKWKDFDIEIKAKLVNWEEERLALIDIILCKMALTEFLYFESIPTTVTLNEYIEIAKIYSTEKSGKFINGILDTLCKEWKEKKLINKLISKNNHRPAIK